jgi:hypothetical protein
MRPKVKPIRDYRVIMLINRNNNKALALPGAF